MLRHAQPPRLLPPPNHVLRQELLQRMPTLQLVAEHYGCCPGSIAAYYGSLQRIQQLPPPDLGIHYH